MNLEQKAAITEILELIKENFLYDYSFLKEVDREMVNHHDGMSYVVWHLIKSTFIHYAESLDNLEGPPILTQLVRSNEQERVKELLRIIDNPVKHEDTNEEMRKYFKGLMAICVELTMEGKSLPDLIKSLDKLTKHVYDGSYKTSWLYQR